MLANSGIAAIVGSQGTGRRTSAIRALITRRVENGDAPYIQEIAPDWGDDKAEKTDKALESEILPDPIPGGGYLIDATARALTTQDVAVLLSWAEQLRSVDARLIVLDTRRGWLAEGRFEVQAVPPDAIQVAQRHLEIRLGKPAHAEWLGASGRSEERRGWLSRDANREVTGVFSDLINPNVSPADSVAIAKRLSKIDAGRVASAVSLLTGGSAEVQQGKNDIRRIREEVLLWTDFLEKTLADTGTRGQDRVMLLSAAYLEDAPIELCIKAAAQFGPAEDTNSRRYREGRSPRRRMREVGVDITADDRAGFASRPGLAPSAIRTDWHHWANERTETANWLERITAADGVASSWAHQIGKRVLELSRKEAEAPFFPLLDAWTSTPAKVDRARIEMIASLLGDAAQTEELARDTHDKLLEWAKQKSAPHRRQVVADVCSGPYGRNTPNRAFVRMRHLLSNSDNAAITATEAIVRYAAGSAKSLTQTVSTVDAWIHDYPDHPAGPRAFLALVDPEVDSSVLASLFFNVATVPAIRDFLVVGWGAALEQTEVRVDAHRILVSWARAVHRRKLDRNLAFQVLTDVRNAHTPVDAMSRFLYGNPDVEDPALIEARYELANLKSCNHASCSNPSCPLREAPAESAADDTVAIAENRNQGEGLA
jgi:hypothetical protein